MNRSALSSRLLLAAAIAAALTGCAATPAIPLAGGIRQTQEQSGRFIGLVSRQLAHAEPFLGVAGSNFYLLRSWLDTRNGATAHQLYVEDSYFGAARDWNAARDAQGQALRFIPISKNEISCESGCSYAEEFAAALPDELLRANPQGLTVIFAARSGAKKTITVPGELVANQLAAMDKVRSTLPAAPPTAAAPAPTPR
jgi:hypothetical protein